MITDRKRPILSSVLHDPHGRRLEYLRLSLTEACNFRCSYCLPKGYRKQKCAPEPLSIAEIERLVRGFAALGLWKVRLTGGEPTIRPEFEEIAAVVASIPGIRHLAMTTNGYKLAQRARDYVAAGVNSINISIDSVHADRFHQITGHDRLEEILEGVDAALAAGFGTVKINTVLMNGVNDDELDAIIAFIANRALSLRFIEVMRTNDNTGFFNRHHLPGAIVSERLEKLGWASLPRAPGAGPAIEYCHPDSAGRIGIIAPYSKDFCTLCNRVRVSAFGKLHLCLFGEASTDLRPLLRTDDQHDELVERIQFLATGKPRAHHLHVGSSGIVPHLASIGG